MSIATAEHTEGSLPGSTGVQNYGVVFILRVVDFIVLQVSENVEKELQLKLEEILNKPFTSILSENDSETFQQTLNKLSLSTTPTSVTLQLKNSPFWLHFHQKSDYYIIECERQLEEPRPFLSLATQIEDGLQRIRAAQEIEAICETAAQIFKSISGYDETLIYQFDDELCENRLTEAKSADTDDYLGLKYWDEPKQTGDSNEMCRYCYIPSVNYHPAALIPSLNQLTSSIPDLSQCTIRESSPAHLEHLKNINVQSAISFVLIQKGQLLGVITCHHRTVKCLTPETRTALSLLAEYVSLQLFLARDRIKNTLKTKALAIQVKLTELMFQAEQRQEDFSTGLTEFSPILTDMVSASGAAIYLDGQLRCIGQVPEHKQIEELIQWLNETAASEVFVTESLSHLFTNSKPYAQIASGLIALTISKEKKDYILFFRPAQTFVMKKAENPKVSIIFAENKQHTPLQEPLTLSSEADLERALPWQPYEIEAASCLRNSVIDRVLHRYLQNQATKLETMVKERTIEIERSNTELEQFAYISSHQLKEPLRMVASFTNLLVTRYMDKIDVDGQEFMGYISDGATRMQQLIDDVLAFAQVSKQQKSLKPVSFELVLRNVLINLETSIAVSNAVITHDSLPTVKAKMPLIIQLFQNLLSNAIKYREPSRELRIHIGVQEQDGQWVISIKDNGIGIDARYFERIFKLFNRLHSTSDYPGTGIGLALCKKIADYHSGRIWLTSQVGQGSIFYFSIPK